MRSSKVSWMNMDINIFPSIKLIVVLIFLCVAACQLQGKEESPAPKPEKPIVPEIMFELALQNSKSYVPERFIREIVESAYQTDRPVLLLALITVESHFDPFAVSVSDAVGCAQIIPKYWLGELVDNKIIRSNRDLRDPKKCTLIADYVLGKYLEKYNGDIEKALAAYNCGPNNRKCLATTGRKYTKKILAKYDEYLYYLKSKNTKTKNN